MEPAPSEVYVRFSGEIQPETSERLVANVKHHVSCGVERVFTDILEQRPEPLGEAAIEELRRVATSAGFGPLTTRALDLLEGAHSDWRTA
jgi:hypothetical protein